MPSARIKIRNQANDDWYTVGGAQNLDELDDVVITTPADNEVLAYDSGSGDWINQTAAEAGLAEAAHTHDIDDLGDVVITTPADNEVLAYDSGSGDWINQTAAEAGLAVASHTHGAGGNMEISLVPEFPGAVLYADGGDNTGEMDGFWDATNRRVAYRWTTSEATAQDYDIVCQFRLPTHFSAWSGGVNVESMVSDATGNTGVRLVEFLDSAGTNAITAATKQNTTWTNDSFTISGGSWSAGGLVTLHFRLIADTDDFAYLGRVYIAFT